jgi:hypothetical protein
LHSCGPTQNLLYHNNGDGTFSRVGSTNTIVARTYPTDYAEAGYWADYDNDGLPDVIVPLGQQNTPNRNQFFRNLGGGRFVFVNNALSTNSVATFSSAWGDFNRDGILDIFLANYVANQTVESQFYWGKPDGSFERLPVDVNAAEPGKRFSATVADFNNDGWPDLVVGSNPAGAIVLYENRIGSFSEGIWLTSGGSAVIGGAWGDYNNDGNMDLYAAYAGAVCKLLRNDGNGAFEQIVEGDLPAEPGGAYSAAWGDYDNDGWLDLFVPRTSFYGGGTENADSLWHNNGDGTFNRVSAETIGEEGVNSWGAAWGDFNNDGFLDLAVGRQDSADGTVRSRLFRNNGNTNHWIVLKLVGTKSNRSAIGAKVRVKATIQGKTFWQMREIGAGAVTSQNDIRAHFGLGDAARVEELRIEWPSGQVTSATNIPAKQFLTIIEPGGPPRLKAERVGSGVRLSISGDANATYELQSTTDLTGWQLVTNVTLTAEGGATHDTTLDEAQRFFRAVKR